MSHSLFMTHLAAWQPDRGGRYVAHPCRLTGLERGLMAGDSDRF
jgi:hypothetical protein